MASPSSDPAGLEVPGVPADSEALAACLDQPGHQEVGRRTEGWAGVVIEVPDQAPDQVHQDPEVAFEPEQLTGWLAAAGGC